MDKSVLTHYRVRCRRCGHEDAMPGALFNCPSCSLCEIQPRASSLPWWEPVLAAAVRDGRHLMGEG